MTLTGGLMIGREDGELVSGSVRAPKSTACPTRCSTPPRSGAASAYALGPETVALYEEKAGFVRPEETVKAHLDRASSSGADLRFGEPVLSWEASGDGVRVETPKSTYEAGDSSSHRAPGPLSCSPDLDLPLEVIRQVMFWYEPKNGLEPFLPERFPIFIWEPEDGNMFYGFPAQDADRGVKAAFFRAGGVPTSPDTIDREVHEEEIGFLRGYLAEHVPELAGRCLDARACMYTNTPDEHFVISAHPEHPQVVIACGFSGHGYKFCSVVGEILADLAIEGSTRHPIDLFSPARLNRADARG